jgi:hypothetical protein
MYQLNDYTHAFLGVKILASDEGFKVYNSNTNA